VVVKCSACSAEGKVILCVRAAPSAAGHFALDSLR
jgi:hypothetical protein